MMDGFILFGAHVIPRLSPQTLHFSTGGHAANTTSKEKISNIYLFQRGKKRSKILDILLQRNLEYAKSKTNTYLELRIGAAHWVVE